MDGREFNADIAEYVCRFLSVVDCASLLDVSRVWRTAVTSYLARLTSLSLHLEAQHFLSSDSEMIPNRICRVLARCKSLNALNINVDHQVASVCPLDSWRAVQRWVNCTSPHVSSLSLDMGSFWKAKTTDLQGSCEELEEEVTIVLREALNHFSSLSQLRIITYTGEIDTHDLARHAPKLTHLSTVDSVFGLTFNNTHSLSQLHNLAVLEVFECVDDNILSSLSSMCPKLSAVRLHQCPISSEGLMRFIAQHPTLTGLGLSTCEGVVLDTTVLVPLAPSLRYLELSDTVVSDFSGILCLPELRMLDLSVTSVDHSNFLKDLFRSSTHLVCCDFRYSNLLGQLADPELIPLKPTTLQVLLYAAGVTEVVDLLNWGPVSFRDNGRIVADLVHSILWGSSME